MTTSAEKIRAWTGPTILSFGFRPFFLLGAIWAALAMVIWVFMLAGANVLPTAFDSVSWHAHEFLFGYLGAVLAGFLLTAVPNWTGRLPIVGWPLAGLVGLWVAGRVAVAISALVPWWAVMAVDTGFLLVLALVLGREIIAGRNWRNLVVLLLVLGMALANALYHLDAAGGGFAAGGIGLRIGLGAAVFLIALIGGRIVPSFTRNWLAQRRSPVLPVPFNRADRAVLALTLVSLLVWIIWPAANLTAVFGALAALAHFWRMSRWAGYHTGAEALVWVLHAGYAFIPLGFLSISMGALLPGMAAAAEHVWMAGGIGLMTLAVMTRASLGHAGKPLHASRPVTVLYLALIVSVLARFAAGGLPEQAWLLHVAAGAWIAAFAGFAVLYWPILTRPKTAQRRPSHA
ncbi:NnrS family protein [Abyssibius alkaniclasticus]|uniref:NnrS family protein n=1 Tax=Abyssibius alkaniclasticus TaxID=2881234 RepID=UPI0023642D41|nr:NnrS family protein [Abyssibius alkaniclasticus]UPH70317.1 NnrS family protein [Abyssibius alkaniclasticus]